MKKILVCNQKMFLTYDEALMLEKKLSAINLSSVSLIVCPSYLNLNIFKNYNLGAQDAFYEDSGPYTSLVSAYQLSLLGVKYCLVGHSERRHIDTDKIINLKIKAMLKNSITPIFCVGETKIDKELRKTSEVLKRQILTGLKDIKLDKDQEILIAYEPRWAIGSGISLDTEEINDAMDYIRKILESLGISNYRLLYGGSINTEIINKISDSNVDGYLIGASSVSADEIKNIINCIK